MNRVLQKNPKMGLFWDSLFLGSPKIAELCQAVSNKPPKNHAERSFAESFPVRYYGFQDLAADSHMHVSARPFLRVESGRSTGTPWL